MYNILTGAGFQEHGALQHSEKGDREITTLRVGSIGNDF